MYTCLLENSEVKARPLDVYIFLVIIVITYCLLDPLAMGCFVPSRLTAAAPPDAPEESAFFFTPPAALPGFPLVGEADLRPWLGSTPLFFGGDFGLAPPTAPVGDLVELEAPLAVAGGDFDRTPCFGAVALLGVVFD